MFAQSNTNTCQTHFLNLECQRKLSQSAVHFFSKEHASSFLLHCVLSVKDSLLYYTFKHFKLKETTAAIWLSVNVQCRWRIATLIPSLILAYQCALIPPIMPTLFRFVSDLLITDKLVGTRVCATRSVCVTAAADALTLAHSFGQTGIWIEMTFVARWIHPKQRLSWLFLLLWLKQPVSGD